MNELVRLPDLLVQDKSLDPAAKYLYMVIQTCQPESISELSKHTGICNSVVSKCCAKLSSGGWITKIRTGSRRVKPVLAIPLPIQDQLILEAQAGLSIASKKMEFIFVKLLRFVIVPSVNLLEHVRPPYLTNPDTGYPMEYDVLLPDYMVAFEVQGRQHYVKTPLHLTSEEFKDARKRDLMKKGISQEQGIILVEITPDDLSVEGVFTKIPDVVPRAEVDLKCRYAQALDKMGEDYRVSMNRAVLREKNK